MYEEATTQQNGLRQYETGGILDRANPIAHGFISFLFVVGHFFDIRAGNAVIVPKVPKVKSQGVGPGLASNNGTTHERTQRSITMIVGDNDAAHLNAKEIKWKLCFSKREAKQLIRW